LFHFLREHFMFLKSTILNYFRTAALPSSAHIYRLLIFKELYSSNSPRLATNRFVCRRQQRNEIMKHFQLLVNRFVSLSRQLYHQHLLQLLLLAIFTSTTLPPCSSCRFRFLLPACRDGSRTIASFLLSDKSFSEIILIHQQTTCFESVSSAFFKLNYQQSVCVHARLRQWHPEIPPHLQSSYIQTRTGCRQSCPSVSIHA
jgi:hypothetical protein